MSLVYHKACEVLKIFFNANPYLVSLYHSRRTNFVACLLMRFKRLWARSWVKSSISCPGSTTTRMHASYLQTLSTSSLCKFKYDHIYLITALIIMLCYADIHVYQLHIFAFPLLCHIFALSSLLFYYLFTVQYFARNS